MHTSSGSQVGPGGPKTHFKLLANISATKIESPEFFTLAT